MCICEVGLRESRKTCVFEGQRLQWESMHAGKENTHEVGMREYWWRSHSEKERGRNQMDLETSIWFPIGNFCIDVQAGLAFRENGFILSQHAVFMHFNYLKSTDTRTEPCKCSQICQHSLDFFVPSFVNHQIRINKWINKMTLIILRGEKLLDLLCINGFWRFVPLSEQILCISWSIWHFSINPACWLVGGGGTNSTGYTVKVLKSHNTQLHKDN